MNDTVNLMLLGGIVMACFVTGLFFLRYWKSTQDRFFFFFMLSFWVEGVNRIVMGLAHTWSENSPAHYIVRLLTYGLILYAIWDKNRPKDR